MGGLRLRVLGFDVRVAPWFLLIMFLIGPQSSGLGAILAWVTIAFVSILAHELGHAVAARSFGHTAEIALHGMGGVTSHRGPPLGRGRTVAVSAAGPLIGVAIGALLRYVVQPADAGWGPTARFAVSAGVFVNLGWGLANLLPILPLDGGHILEALLPGGPRARLGVARRVSVVVGLAVAILAWRSDYRFGAMLAGILAVQNLLSGSSGDDEPRGAASAPAPPPRTLAADEVRRLEQALTALLDEGYAEQARHLLNTSPYQWDVDPAVRERVLAQPDFGPR